MPHSPSLKSFFSRRSLRVRLVRFRRNDQVILFFLAVLVGLAVGLAAIGFRDLIVFLQGLTLGSTEERIASHVAQLPWWRVLLVPTLGGLCIGIFVYRYMPDRRPQGVADVMEASALHGGQMSARNGLKAAAVSAASIGVGASVGREGPLVHLGAVLGSLTARRLHLGRRLIRTLLGCGVAAGVAASFNAPIAGVFFALEVVIGHYALSAFAPVVIAGVIGTLITRMHYGDFPAFILPVHHNIASLWEVPAFALLGVVAAVMAIIFIYSVAISQKVAREIPVPAWLRPAGGGLLVGLIALWFPEVLGVGYEATDNALSENYGLWFLLALIAAKTAATAISLGAGFGGGVFAPSLFLGAMMGGAYGLIAGSVFPELASDQGAYTIVGMAAVAGAVLGAPISTIMIVFEMTGDYALTIALMVATAIASVIVDQVGLPSFFSWQLESRGVNVKRGQEVGLLHDIKVRTLIDRNYTAVSPDMPIQQVREALVKAPFGELLVVDGNGVLVGTITFADLAQAAFDFSHDDELSAQSVARKKPPLLQADDDLEDATNFFHSAGEPHVPVVDDRSHRKLLGLAHEHEVMAAYHRALVQARAEERGT
ncbi:chloride channel protein [Rhodovibrionaceae bacterium A322]